MIQKTTIQLDDAVKKRFKKLLEKDRKERQERKLVEQDFLTRLMDKWEQSDGTPA